MSTPPLFQPPTFAAVIARDMRALPEATRRALRPKLRAAGQAIMRDAMGRASWSTRIPGAMRVTTSFRQGREGVKVTVNGRIAPHARAYEDLTTRGPEFKHPVFGRKGARAMQATRPFLLPAAQAAAPTVNQMMRDALDEAAQQAQSGGQP